MTLPNRRLLEQTVSLATQLLMFAQPADAALSAFFRAQKSGQRERAFIAETAYAVLRHKRSLTAWLGGTPHAGQLVLAALLRHAGFSQRQLIEAVSPADAEWLAGLKARPEPALALADSLDLPDWLIEKLRHAMDADALAALARALNRSAPLDLRVNPLKSDRTAVLARLHADGLVATACPFSPLGIRLSGKPALAKHPLFVDGSIEVQDEGSQLLGYLLAPRRGEMVVDFCAGAGGKTLLLGALMRSTGRLYAFDVSDKRLARLKPRLARSGLSNVHPVMIAHENDSHVKRLAGKCDRAMVDAPCSGLGTLRRNPDLKWRQTPAGIVELTHKQTAILASAARLLKPGGRLVYATCSLLAEENEAIVDAFLANQPQFARRSAGEALAAQGIRIEASGEASSAQMGDDLRLLPQVHGTDGFYAAVLERTA